MTLAQCHSAHRADLIAMVGPLHLAQQALAYANVMPTILFRYSIYGVGPTLFRHDLRVLYI